VAASRKDLVNLVLPYRAFFEGPATGNMKAFKAALDKEMTLTVSKGNPADPPEAPEPDLEHSRRVSELRPLLQNKVLLLIGGNKGQGWRKEELKKELGLKDVLWPDLEDTTKLKGIFHEVDHADYVAQLIRWSRHHYSEILDYAKGQNKPVVRVLSGLGLTRITRDLHDQMVAHA
jgi:hypothetical protein